MEPGAEDPAQPLPGRAYGLRGAQSESSGCCEEGAGRRQAREWSGQGVKGRLPKEVTEQGTLRSGGEVGKSLLPAENEG